MVEPVADERPLVMSYLLMRKFVGAIGVLLPFVLMIGNAIIGRTLEPSMSGYYYTPMRNVFVGALWALGIFLISYNGWDRGDKVVTDIAGISAIGISLCPTTPADNPTATQVTVGDIHLGFACAAFAMLALMSLRFAKREPTPATGLTLWQRIGYAFGFTPPGVSAATPVEIVIYRVSGLVIAICIVLFPVLAGAGSYSLLILEVIMLVAFGVAWFVKGTTLPGKAARAAVAQRRAEGGETRTTAGVGNG
jgi:hypothetical protein